MYGQAIKRGNNTVWTICTELRDLQPNTTAGMVGWECGMFGRGQDNNGLRVGIDLVYGGGYPYDSGDNEISYGLRISALQGQSDWVPGTTNGFETSSTTGRAIMKCGVQMKGNIGIGIDLGQMKNTYSDTAILLADSLKLKWTNGAYFGFGSNEMQLGMPGSGLSGGAAVPGNPIAFLKVNVANLGSGRIPVYAA